MSIWSSFGGVDGLYEVGYGPLGEPNPKAFLDLAMAKSHYGDTALRISLDDDDEHACAVLSRDQVAELVEDLQEWLGKAELKLLAAEVERLNEFRVGFLKVRAVLDDAKRRGLVGDEPITWEDIAKALVAKAES